MLPIVRTPHNHRDDGSPPPRPHSLHAHARCPGVRMPSALSSSCVMSLASRSDSPAPSSSSGGAISSPAALTADKSRWMAGPPRCASVHVDGSERGADEAMPEAVPAPAADASDAAMLAMVCRAARVCSRKSPPAALWPPPAPAAAVTSARVRARLFGRVLWSMAAPFVRPATPTA